MGLVAQCDVKFDLFGVNDVFLLFSYALDLQPMIVFEG